MKKIRILPVLLVILLAVTAAYAQTETLESVAEILSGTTVQRMIWSEDGSVLTLVTADTVVRYPVSGDAPVEKYAAEPADASFVSVSEDGLAAVLSSDRQAVFLYEPGSAEKDLVTVETGFETLSVTLSDDGALLLADSAEQIRTVIYDSADGSVLYDLTGFGTAAPVYDSTLSRDGQYVLWHSRGTFAVQKVSDGSFGETVSLWDFASSYGLSPDNRMIAVGIINEDYENGAVIFFDAKTGKEKGRVDLGKFAPHALSYSADGSALWAADSGSIYLIDPKNFTLKDQADVFAPDSEENRIIRIAASPDGLTAGVLTSSGKIFLAH